LMPANSPCGFYTPIPLFPSLPLVPRTSCVPLVVSPLVVIVSRFSSVIQRYPLNGLLPPNLISLHVLLFFFSRDSWPGHTESPFTLLFFQQLPTLTTPLSNDLFSPFCSGPNFGTSLSFIPQEFFLSCTAHTPLASPFFHTADSPPHSLVRLRPYLSFPC